MRITWLGLRWEARSRSRGDPCLQRSMPAGSIPRVELLTGDKTCHHQTPFLVWKKKEICCLGSYGFSFLAGLGSVRSGHPTRAPGRNLGKNKEQNLIQLCRKLPGMAVPPQHRAVPRTEVPQSSTGAWFSLGSNAGKLPSLVCEIQDTK